MKKKDDILDVDEWTTNREQPVCSLERIREIRREVLCEKSEPSVLESEVLGRPHKDPLFEKKKAEQKTREEHFFVEKKHLRIEFLTGKKGSVSTIYREDPENTEEGLQNIKKRISLIEKALGLRSPNFPSIIEVDEESRDVFVADGLRIKCSKKGICHISELNKK